MEPAVLAKSDFIKFNVSPKFKSIVADKAKQKGLTLSELGRLLFGAFANDLLSPHSIDLVKMAQTADSNFRQGKGKTFKDADSAISYLQKLE